MADREGNQYDISFAPDNAQNVENEYRGSTDTTEIYIADNDINHVYDAQTLK